MSLKQYLIMQNVVFLVVVFAVISSVDNACDNCHRCVNDTCGIHDRHQCYCINGCKTGYFGKGCRQDCPEQCVTCGREYGLQGDPTYHICYECATGFHNGSSTSCLCPINCENCTSTTTCTICKDGWYDTKCNKMCPTNCTKCESSTKCTACQKGLHGGVCEESCSQNCNGSVCRKIDGTCKHGCVNGWFGNKCYRKCPSTCKNGTCSEGNGSCTNGCVDNFDPGTDGNCTICVKGKFGENCEDNCTSETCLNNECDRDTGKCKECAANFTLGPDNLCNVCVAGKYGQNCNLSCKSSTCFENKCDQVNGTCSKNCKANFALGKDNLCNVCSPGLYGVNCEQNCKSDTCKGNICNRNNGTCIDCEENFVLGSKHLCSSCVSGKYGEDCSLDCPATCYGNTCNKADGSCTNECVANFTAGSDGKCSVCVNGMFGKKCTQTCRSEICLNNACDRATGLCKNCTGNFALGKDNLCDICKIGFHGQNCDIDCPANCMNDTCNMDNGTCTHGCKQYFATGDDRKCNICIHGKYGIDCKRDCLSQTCLNNVCDKISGKCDDCIKNAILDSYMLCDKCIAGYYEADCSAKCPSTSCKNKTCNKIDGACTYGCATNYSIGEDNMCRECIRGKYGDNCQKDCLSKSCFNNSCNQDDGKCIKCKNNFELGENKLCDVCIAGKYGKSCNKSCISNECFNKECDRNSGGCSNGCSTTTITGALCNTCINGTYGHKCQYNCSFNCKYSACNRSHGECTFGCRTTQFRGDKCDKCVNGFYGSLCNLTCPLNCKNGTCNKTNGECSNGCIGNFNGKTCDSCVDGFYGMNCSATCFSENCFGKVCNKTTGECHSCKTGWYGRYCNRSCSNGCMDETCAFQNGMCNCIEGFTGDKCCVKGGHCETCANITTCLNCEDGYYGEICDNPCPENCLDNCTKINGDCFSCKRGFFGSQCEYNCSVTCLDETGMDLCDEKNGTCLLGCLEGYYKDQCSDFCNINCINSTCEQMTGKCVEGCTIGYYGVQCSLNCSNSCLGSVCDQDTGVCADCVDGRYGDTCNLTCNNQCKNGTCERTYGACLYGCSGGYEGNYCSQQPLSDSEGGDVAGPVVGVLFVLVAAIMVVALIWYFKRRNGDNLLFGIKLPFISTKPKLAGSEVSYHTAIVSNETYATQETANGELSNEIAIDIVTDVDGHSQDPVYGNVPELRKAVDVKDLFNFVSEKDLAFFQAEFQLVPPADSVTVSAARKPENKGLNRFRGIYPYDHSRVTLKEDPNFYMNACFINGYSTERAYIASVGPTSDITNKFTSFWKMVWYQKADVIVMLTNLNEESGMKCEKYWPDEDQTVVYGDISVTNDGTDVYAEYNMTQFTIKKDGHMRKMTHLQYTAWPDKSVPDNVVSLVEFRQRVKSVDIINGGPTIVHCSAGVGRTGTYIALDILTEQGKCEKRVNVFDCVTKLREQRVKMVQTHEQYDYLYRCIVYTLVYGSEPIMQDRLGHYLTSLNDEDYVRKYRALKCTVEKLSEAERQAKESNKEQTSKNRQGADVPGNKDRPRLWLNRTFNQSDYINAVYVNSFKTRHRFIAAQTPLKETIVDFLCMIYQTKCACIVDMNDAASTTKHDVGIYVPSEGATIKIGSFSVRCTKRENHSSFVKCILVVKNLSKQMPGEVTVEHYQYTGWKTEGRVPDSTNEFVQFVNLIQVAGEVQDEDGFLRPTVIHCLDACTRTGLVLTLSILLEKMNIEQQVSIDNTIRQMRLRRPNAIPNEAQYKFCHDSMFAYMDMFSEYSNVTC